MKKLLLSLFLCAAALNGYSQCTPDTSIHKVGMYPSTLPPATAGTAYSQVIQFKFPKDTVVAGFSASIDSVRLDSVKGMPSSFHYTCGNASCIYRGGENGCATISGSPVTADTGRHRVIIYATAFTFFGGSELGVPYQDTVFFTIQPGSSGLNKKLPQAWNFSVQQNYPNPFSISTQITFTMPRAEDVSFRVYDLLGKPVYSRPVAAARGENTITLEKKQLPAGLYFYSIECGSQAITKRMSIR